MARSVLLLAVFGLISQAAPSDPDARCDPCTQSTDPTPKTGSVSDQNANFVWYSDADRQVAGKPDHCYVRYVRNKHTSVLSLTGRSGD